MNQNDDELFLLKFISRNKRSKNFKTLNASVSAKKNILTKFQSKKTFKQKVITKIFIFSITKKDFSNERIVFIDNYIKLSMFALYRKIEKTKSMFYI